MLLQRCLWALAFFVATSTSGRADVYRWDNGQLIPGTETVTLGPSIDLSSWHTVQKNLRYADLSGSDLTDANFFSSWLDSANLTGANLTGANLTSASLNSSTLTNANLTGAVVTGTSFWDTTSRGFTKAQLESTASYQAKDLQGIGLWNNDLAGWDFRGQKLTNAILSYSTLTNADLSGANLTGALFEASTLTSANLQGANLKGAHLVSSTLSNANLTGAVVTGANLWYTTARGFTKAQLESTASYQAKKLQAIGLVQNDLTGWDFSGQDFTGANLSFSTLTHANLQGSYLSGAHLESSTLIGANLNSSTLAGANLTGAVVTRATLVDTTSRGFTKAQLESTASYRAKDLQGIGLSENGLRGWDFRGQNLTSANLFSSTLTNANLEGANLTGANLSSSTLTNANLGAANLTGARLESSSLTNANLTGAVLTGATLVDTTSRGFTKGQLESTASYQAKNLQGIELAFNDLTSWDFGGQNLTAANLASSKLTGANLTGANLRNANLLGAEGLQSAVVASNTVYNQWTVFPTHFDPLGAGLAFMPSPLGDMEADDDLDVADVDLLTNAIWQGIDAPMFNLNADQAVDTEDLRVWVKDLKQTGYGDANVDGEFNTDDFVTIFQAGQYEDGLAENSTWSTGDWNADGEFTASDLVVAFQNGGYEQGPTVGVAAVPEPSSFVLLILAWAFCVLAPCRVGGTVV